MLIDQPDRSGLQRWIYLLRHMPILLDSKKSGKKPRAVHRRHSPLYWHSRRHDDTALMETIKGPKRAECDPLQNITLDRLQITRGHGGIEVNK